MDSKFQSIFKDTYEANTKAPWIDCINMEPLENGLKLLIHVFNAYLKKWDDMFADREPGGPFSDESVESALHDLIFFHELINKRIWLAGSEWYWNNKGIWCNGKERRRQIEVRWCELEKRIFNKTIERKIEIEKNRKFFGRVYHDNND